jgi:hypothetical protein
MTENMNIDCSNIKWIRKEKVNECMEKRSIGTVGLSETKQRRKGCHLFSEQSEMWRNDWEVGGEIE